MADKPKKPQRRLTAAEIHGKNLSELIKAAMPSAPPRRERKVLVAFTPDEAEQLEELAEERREALAVTVRNLALASLRALRGE